MPEILRERGSKGTSASMDRRANFAPACSRYYGGNGGSFPPTEAGAATHRGTDREGVALGEQRCSPGDRPGTHLGTNLKCAAHLVRCGLSFAKSCNIHS